MNICELHTQVFGPVYRTTSLIKRIRISGRMVAHTVHETRSVAMCSHALAPTCSLLQLAASSYPSPRRPTRPSSQQECSVRRARSDCRIDSVLLLGDLVPILNNSGGGGGGHTEKSDGNKFVWIHGVNVEQRLCRVWTCREIRP